MKKPTTLIYMNRYDDEEYLFSTIVAENSLIYERMTRWETDKKGKIALVLANSDVQLLKHSLSSYDSHRYLFWFREVLVLLNITKRGRVDFKASSRESMDEINAIIEETKKIISVTQEPDDSDIKVSFWHITNNGPVSSTRKIAAPKWNEVAANYSTKTRDGLSKLMNFDPEKGGQLILMHGHPGAGKTYSLRALCQEWKSWCNIHYILDPEQLFGGSAYFSSLILDGEPVDDDEEEESPEDIRKPWRLIILEDTGELLANDARIRSGQGLSRLLNLVDGFIGQGLRVLVLITTNEELEKLHPAVAREGRCAAAIEFRDFTYAEALEWAKLNDITLPEKKDYSLADLYAIKKGSEAIRVEEDEPSKGPLGFRMPDLEGMRAS